MCVAEGAELKIFEMKLIWNSEWNRRSTKNENGEEGSKGLEEEAEHLLAILCFPTVGKRPDDQLY